MNFTEMSQNKKTEENINGRNSDKWNIVSLGNLLKEVDIRVKNVNGNIEKMPILSMTRYNGLILQSDKFGKRVASKNLSNYKVVKINNIVYSFPMDEGVIYALKNFDIGLVSPTYTVLEKNSNNIDIIFLDILLKSPKLISTYKKLSSRTVDRRRIVSKNDFFNITIELPPLVEQRGIAEVLGTVDEAIRRTDTIIAKAEELKRGLMQRFLTRGIGHTEFKQTELGEIPETWGTTKLGDLCSRITKGTTPTTYGFNYTEEGINFIKIENINESGKFLIDSFMHINQDTHTKLNRSQLTEGDVLFSIAGALGRTAIVPSEILPANTNQALAIIRLKNKTVSPQYLKYFLSSNAIQQKINKIRIQSAQANINLSHVEDFDIIIMPKEEEEKIVRILSYSEKRLELEKQSKRRFEELKNGLMQVLLSGKVRVRLDEGGLHRVRDG